MDEWSPQAVQLCSGRQKRILADAWDALLRDPAPGGVGALVRRHLPQRLADALLEEAGVGASVVDVDAFAIHNAFEYNYPDAARGVVALVNVGHEISTILIQQDGVPSVTREAPFGSRHIREELRRMHGLSQDEAESIIQGHSGRAEEFALDLDFEMRRLGAEDVSFETIVASGPNGAKPHHRAGGRRGCRGSGSATSPTVTARSGRAVAIVSIALGGSSAASRSRPRRRPLWPDHGAADLVQPGPRRLELPKPIWRLSSIAEIPPLLAVTR